MGFESTATQLHGSSAPRFSTAFSWAFHGFPSHSPRVQPGPLAFTQKVKYPLNEKSVWPFPSSQSKIKKLHGAESCGWMQVGAQGQPGKEGEIYSLAPQPIPASHLPAFLTRDMLSAMYAGCWSLGVEFNFFKYVGK